MLGSILYVRLSMPKPYVIVGPNDEQGLPQYWTLDWCWGDFTVAIHYGKEVFQFPPRELPLGGRGILDLDSGMLYYPRWPEGRGNVSA